MVLKKISVHISEENIKDGERNNPCYCPIALAISDKYKIHPKRIYVSPETALFMREGEFYFELSREALNFIHRYDAGFVVDPITIEGKLVRKYGIR